MSTTRPEDMASTWSCTAGALMACPVCRQLDVPKSGLYNAHCIPPIMSAFRKWHRLSSEGFCPPPPATDLYCFTCHVVFDESFIHQTNNLIELYNTIPEHAVDVHMPRVCRIQLKTSRTRARPTQAIWLQCSNSLCAAWGLQGSY